MLYFHVWELVPNQGKNIFFVTTENGKKVFGCVLLKTLSGVESTSVSQDSSTQDASTNLGISIPSPPMRNRPHSLKVPLFPASYFTYQLID